MIESIRTVRPRRCVGTGRLIDLANVSGISATVRRLLPQLIAVGAVRREGTRYRLGASLLGLGSRVSPERRLRVAARRPIAELATATGAAVQLSAVIGGEAVYLDAVDARIPLGLTAEPGAGYRQEPRLPEPTPNWAALHR